MKVTEWFNSALAVSTLYFLVTLCFEYPSGSFVNDVPLGEKITVRINTFRRLDLLKQVLPHYSSCSCVDSVQVVWSDQENKPPASLAGLYSNVHFEVHSTNSLNNRFLPLTIINTSAVLSIDDDIIVPCDELEMSLGVWTSSKRSLVGFSPRFTAMDIITGRVRYLRWQHTWWNGIYSIMLTKAAILHKHYLHSYRKEVPDEVLKFIDENRNCEDIAMAYVVAKESHAPPVWVQSIVYEIGSSGISSSTSHFVTRGECVETLEKYLGPNHWVSSYMKVVPMGWGKRLDWGLMELRRLFQQQ